MSLHQFVTWVVLVLFCCLLYALYREAKR